MVKRWQLGNGEMMEPFDASEPTFVLAADYDALAAELASVEEICGEPYQLLLKARKRIAALEADARRYQWLRVNDLRRSSEESYAAPSSGYLLDVYQGEALDQEIDRAMALTPDRTSISDSPAPL